MRGMLSFEDALAEVLRRTGPLPAVRVPLEDAAGRVLSEPVLARADLPSADLSLMDGYAVRAADGAAGAVLRVAFEVAAGATSPRALAPGECARIFTGAPLPDGADAVVMQERAVREGAHARFHEGAHPGQHVRRRGEELRGGAVALGAGTLLGPAELSLAASCGLAHVSVHAAPRCALLATGDELLPPGSAAEPGKLVESNTFALAAMARAAGAEPVTLGIVRDDLKAIAHRLETRADVVVSSGGASVGDYDFAQAALERAGGKVVFHQVAIRPGKPTLLGELPGGRLYFGLPGNPAAAMLTFELFVRPALRRLLGEADPSRPVALARFEGKTLARPPGMTFFARGRATFFAEALVFRAPHAQSSMQIGSWVGANALAVLPPGPGEVKSGDAVDVMLLGF